MRVSRARLILMVIGLSGLILAGLQLTSGERKASASEGESLLDQLRPDRVPPTLEVPVGTSLPVRLKERITEGNRAGDVFIGRLDGYVEHSGNVMIPRGSRVIGRITGLGEDTRRSSTTAVSLVLEQVVVGKKAIPLRTFVLSLSTPDGAASLGSESLLLDKAPGLLTDEESPTASSPGQSEETIYEPDTVLTFVLAERLWLPVFVRED